MTLTNSIIDSLPARDVLSCVLLKERKQSVALLPQKVASSLDTLFEGDILKIIQVRGGIAASYETARLHDLGRVLMYWEKMRPLSEGLISEIRATYQRTLGAHLEYPLCCTERFAQDFRQNIKPFERFLQERPDANEFAAVPYVPCSTTCENTKHNGYSAFIADKYPALFERLVREFERENLSS